VSSVYHRVRFHDRTAYQRKDVAARERILHELTAEARERGMGFS
jgi:hypothetical protein